MYGLLGYDNIWPIYNYLKIWNLRVQKNLNTEKITFKVVQMKFLAIHITNQKLSFDIFMVGNLQNIFMEHDLYPNDFWHKRKIDNFDSYDVFLAIATNIPQRLKTGFVVQGHKCLYVDFNKTIVKMSQCKYDNPFYYIVLFLYKYTIYIKKKS